MIAGLLTSWPTQAAIVAFAAWFARGVWCACMRPRLQYVTHTRIGKTSDVFVEVLRQQRLPPFQQKRETWFVCDAGDFAYREGDGYRVARSDEFNGLWLRLDGLRRLAFLRDAELDSYVKETRE